MRVAAAFAALFLAASLQAGEATKAKSPKSGLEKGADVPPFQVFDATGPNKGKSLCYI